MIVNNILIIILIISISVINTSNVGLRAPFGLFKYVASVQYHGEHWCSGTIVHEAHVITTARCVNDISSDSLSVIGGTIFLKDQHAQYRQVESIHIPHDSILIINPLDPNNEYWANDIAILRLEEPFDWGPNIAPIRIPCKNYNFDNAIYCMVTKWYNGNLLWSNAQILNDDDCCSWGIFLLNNQKCAYGISNTVIDFTNSGNLLICDNFAVGLILEERIENGPFIYLTFTSFYEFLRLIVDSDDINSSTEGFQYAVTIWNNEIYKCAGSILDSMHILTAGHCVIGIDVTTLKVSVGSLKVRINDPQIKWIRVVSAKIPEYSQKIFSDDGMLRFYSHDLGILTLEKSLIWSPKIQQLPLSLNIPNVGELCQVWRWIHLLMPNGDISLEFSPSPTTIISTGIDPSLYPHLLINEFCSDYLYSIYVALPGDSGSPVLCGGMVVGILTAGPAIYTLNASNSVLFFLNVNPYLENFIIINAPETLIVY